MTVTIVRPPGAIVNMVDTAVIPFPGGGVLADLRPWYARNLGKYADPASPWGATKENARTDYSGLAADAARRRVLLFGGGHGGAQMTDVRTLDMATAQWSSLYPSLPWAETKETNLDRVLGKWISVNAPTARHTYNMSLVVGDRYYLLTAAGMVDNTVDSVPALGPWTGRVCWYDFTTQDWTFSTQSGTLWNNTASAALDPISGKVLVVGPGPGASAARMWLYDPATDARQELRSIPTTPTLLAAHSGAIDLVYFPPNDRFYLIPKVGKASTVYEIALNRATPTQTTIAPVTITGASPPSASNEPMGYAFDTVNHIIGGHVVNGLFFALDPVARTWVAKPILFEGVPPTPLPTQVFHCLEFDPASGCFVFLENSPSTVTPRKTTWAYRYG